MHFLQGLVTNDIEGLEPGQGTSAALLTPQGKVVHSMLIFRAGGRLGDDGILIDVSAPASADLRKRLMFYRLRSKVDIEIADDLCVATLWGARAPEAALIATPDPRLTESGALGQRVILPADGAGKMLENAGFKLGSAEDYHASRTAAGVAEQDQDFGPGEVFAHDLALDQLHGVDFHKGCYVGQEVVSRMQHRGTARRRPLVFKTAADVPAGTDIMLGSKSVGQAGKAVGGHVVGIVRLDKCAQAIGTPDAFEIAGHPATAMVPTWAEYSALLEAIDEGNDEVRA